MKILNVKELTMDDMKYIDAVVAEEFGHHAMIYHATDKFCWLANPIELPYEQGKLIAIGMWDSDKEDLVMKVQKAEDYVYHTNAIEI